jgi:von Willebrand factor type A domain/Trypsin-like peptidase domain
MSHRTGTVQTVSPELTIGPDSGGPATSPGTWAVDFAHTPAPPPGGTKLLILHFQNVNLPAANRLEVDLGYGTDVFTSIDGPAFWTRPVNIYKLAGGLVPIRYITAGSASGSVQLDRYGRGESLPATLALHNSVTNSDPFLKDPHYTEPKYDDFWICSGSDTENWENGACVTGPSDVRARVALSVGMIVSPEGTELSTCTVTLVDSDKVISAGHCHTPAEALASSVTFDYLLECDGDRPGGYDARFYKVVEVLEHRYDGGPGNPDYSLLRLAEGPAGIPAIQLRHDIPAAGEQVFGVHHPNGAPKKLSVPHPGFATVLSSNAGAVNVPSTFHVAGGTSGSGLFDTAGRIVGVCSTGDPCGRTGPAFPVGYYPTASIASLIAPTPPPPVTRDVMVVFDRSGSMSQLDQVGRVKIEAARDAVSLFVQLVKSSVGNRAGLISFSSTAKVDFALQPVDDPHKQTLIGAAPFSGGIVGGLASGGSTSIGEGLDKARLQFPGPGANPRSILLLTDGMQNTPRWIGDVEGALGGIDVQVIGFGTDANLDSALLASLAAAHNGVYTRAESGLALEKFFAQAFGSIFENGLLSDPEHDLPANESGPAFDFTVCGEDMITVVVGWNDPDADLFPRVRSPGGNVITTASPGVQQHAGHTWRFMRIPLPQAGERDGTWTVSAQRPGGGGEFPPPAPPLRYFIDVIPTGGPLLRSVTERRRYYTGDFVNPLVSLRYDDGGWPEDASARLTITRPTASIGCLLAREGLRPPTTSDGDTIPAWQATVAALQQAAGGPLIPDTTHTITLSDDPAGNRGAFEPAGVFGAALAEFLTTEGNYQLHYHAEYGGPGCVAQRELLTTLHVDVGIDPAHTPLVAQHTGSGAGGARTGTITFTPKDRFGNCLGPGRPTDFTVDGAPGTAVTGPPVDNGDGSYTVPGSWGPGVEAPGLVIGQPGRPPVTAWPPGTVQCRRWRLLSYLLALLVLALLVALVLILLFG